MLLIRCAPDSVKNSVEPLTAKPCTFELELSSSIGWQAPAEHDPPKQLWPQLPQLFGSMLVSEQLPLHVVAQPQTFGVPLPAHVVKPEHVPHE